MKRVNQCFNARLSEIVHHALQIKTLNATLRQYLPANLCEHVTVGSFHQGCLVLSTNDPIWASQLRYHLPELRNTLRTKAGLYELGSIKISVCSAPFPELTALKQKLPPLSPSVCQTIIETSELCEYEPLKQALKNLATQKGSTV